MIYNDKDNTTIVLVQEHNLSLSFSPGDSVIRWADELVKQSLSQSVSESVGESDCA